MTSYIPCMECKNRYGREYSKICDGFCDYAKAVKEKKQLEDDRRQNNEKAIKKQEPKVKELQEEFAKIKIKK